MKSIILTQNYADAPMLLSAEALPVFGMALLEQGPSKVVSV